MSGGGRGPDTGATGGATADGGLIDGVDDVHDLDVAVVLGFGGGDDLEGHFGAVEGGGGIGDVIGAGDKVPAVDVIGEAR